MKFLFLLLILLVHVCGYELIDELSDTVESGGEKFYTLNPRPVTLICLISDEGDADLYVDYTSSTSRPDYLTHRYSATTSGLDVVTVLWKGDNTLSIGVHGHIAHDNSSYRLYILAPNPTDVLDHQIWEVDPDDNTKKLIIDVDPLWMANDPKLHRMLELLSTENHVHKGTSDWVAVKDWIMWFIVNFIHILEILA